MKKFTLYSVLFLITACATPQHKTTTSKNMTAAQASLLLEPLMTKQDVISKIGSPISKSADKKTETFYYNGLTIEFNNSTGLLHKSFVSL